MEKHLLSKKDLLLYAKNATQSILNSLVAIKFIKAELYIVNKDIYSKLLEIDSLLLPHKKDTRKTNIYSIDTFVNILNPTYTAFTYTLTPVYKRKQISDFSKIQLALDREYAVSIKMLNHEFDEYIKNNDISELTYQEKLLELDTRLKLEKQYSEAIKTNPDKYMNNKLKIATQPILHGQIRYYFINNEGEKEDMQRHLSSEIPNILIFDENSGFTKRKDNKIDAFLEDWLYLHKGTKCATVLKYSLI